MTNRLENILVWIAAHLPASRRVWVDEMRIEAKHIPAGFSRARFLWGGVIASLGEVARFKLGPRRVGQILLGGLLLLFCIGGGSFIANIDSSIVKIIYSVLLALYAVTAGLTLYSLKVMKRFVLVCAMGLGMMGVTFRLNVFGSTDLPVLFLQAISIEAAAIMCGLYIAASYLTWMEGESYA